MNVAARREFALPDVGEGLTEAEIVTWRVGVGDTVAINDILVEIETAKSLVELPSPFSGVVAALLVPEGSTVPVGTPLIAIEDQEAGPSREPTLVGYGASPSAARRRRKLPATIGSVVPLHGSSDGGGSRRVQAKPPVRKLAKELGIDLTQVPSAGTIVTRADVQAYAAARSGAAIQLTSPVELSGDLRVPVRGVRKAMADAMMRSTKVAPQATEWLTIDVSRTVELVDRLRGEPTFAAVHLTPTVVVAKAIILALRRSPSLNASWVEELEDRPAEVLLHGTVNLGFAVATDRGLVVPNVKSAERLSMI